MSTMSRSSTTTDGARELPPVHPGEVLREDVMGEMGLTTSDLAQILVIPEPEIAAIAAGHSGMTAEIALRLSRYLGTTPEFWMRLQADFDIETAMKAAGDRIEREVQPLKSAG